jgi:chloramphenicol O-acetyltransferase type B
MTKNPCEHWSQVEWLHQTVKNKNILIKGTHSYYSAYYTGCFEESVVRYLYGDDFSTDSQTGWKPLWEIDRLIIGDYVQIAADVKIILGGNNTHNPQLISTYPFRQPEALKRSYEGRGDTVIGNDVWLGTACLILPGVQIGNGALIAAYSVVTQSVPAYAIYAGNPARLIRYRFSEAEIALLQALEWWNWPEEKVKALLPYIQGKDIEALVAAGEAYDQALNS